MAGVIPQARIRPYGFALIRPAGRPQLDTSRIVTLSGTIAINLVAMGLLMMPLSAPLPVAWTEPDPDMSARIIKREPVVVDVVPVRDPAPTEPRPAPTRPRTMAPSQSSATASAVIAETGTELVAENVATEDTGPTVESIAPMPTGPAPVQLEYARAPAPKYPRNAQRLGHTGTVVLQVLVGMDGLPLNVDVFQSSGHRELDEAARAQVLMRWSFRPATRDGISIQAIGLVPVQFSLQR